jgi:Cellulase (glycosyl hydrolase family 5)
MTPVIALLLLAAVVQGSTTVRVGDTFQLTGFPHGWEEERGKNTLNPFDPAQVAVRARFTCAGGGQAAVLIDDAVPGFFFQNFTRSYDSQKGEILTPRGKPTFVVRFTPRAPGECAYRLEGRLHSFEHGSWAPLKEGKFAVLETPRWPGFVRRSGTYFRLDNGTGVWPVGEDMAWPSTRNGTYDMERWMTALAAHGGSWIRVWFGGLSAQNCFVFETTATGLGKYDLAALWRVDKVLQIAESLGIFVQFCVNSYNSVRETNFYPAWSASPYNSANPGGVIQHPPEFFTSDLAESFYKQRLSYVIARWSYSPNVWAFEFWNEIDGEQNYISDKVARWHRKFADLARRLDVNRHMLTTSFAQEPGDVAVDSLPELDFSQTHCYSSNDFGQTLVQLASLKRAIYAKPTIVAEFGVSAMKQDPTGLNIHNALWSCLVGGCGAGSMTWWWDSYGKED